jgi:hypothetical protein
MIWKVNASFLQAPCHVDVLGSGSIISCFLDLQTMWLSGELHAPAELPQRKLTGTNWRDGLL